MLFKQWQYVAELGESSDDAYKSMKSDKDPMPQHVWKTLFNLGKKCTEQKKKHRPSSKQVRHVCMFP